MKAIASVFVIVSLVMGVGQTSIAEAAPMGTAFTYQGRLIDANNIADGLYDFQFRLYDEADAGTQRGSTIEVNDLDIIDGYFTVSLEFGSGVFDGNDRWLQIGVRPGVSNDINDFVALSPRQKVTPTPYALYAASGTPGPQGPQGSAGPTLGIYDSLGLSSSGGRAAGDAGRRDLYNLGDLTVEGVIETVNGPTTRHRLALGLGNNSYFNIGGGNVGIGTSSPAYRLDVAGPANLGISDGVALRVNGLSAIEWEDGLVGHFIWGDGAQGNDFTRPVAIHNDLSVDGEATLKGDVGIGTTNPDRQLTIYESGSAFQNIKDGTHELLMGVDSFGGIVSVYTNHDLVFRAGGNSEKMRIKAGGNVGIGDTDPTYRLELPNNADTTGRGRANSWVTYSSGRWKTNIDAISDPVEKVKKLRGVYFDWKKTGTHDIGMIAEEVAEVIPEVVGYEQDSGNAESLDYGRLVALLVEAVKELKAEKDAEIARLQKQVSDLTARLERMEAMMTQISKDSLERVPR